MTEPTGSPGGPGDTPPRAQPPPEASPCGAIAFVAGDRLSLVLVIGVTSRH
ncbi:hypothetical protein [Dactylosporangium sp. NPDC051484]|uniref:hypothetical protein n=1 Tax=Dactylosporangium sp. NPDC051484 TaxID=3154942 RepID=UPI00344DB5A3